MVLLDYGTGFTTLSCNRSGGKSVPFHESRQVTDLDDFFIAVDAILSNNDANLHPGIIQCKKYLLLNTVFYILHVVIYIFVYSPVFFDMSKSLF